MRGLRSFFALLAVAVGLGAYIYFVEWKRTPDETPRDLVFAGLESGDVEELTVRAESGETTSLRKVGGDWQVVEPFDAPADQSEVSGITGSLSTLELARVVDEGPADLGEYGLDEPRLALAFRTSEGERREILIGDTTATGGDLYAKQADADRVFLIPAYLESTFNRTPFDLRDKRVLRFDRDGADTLTLAARDRAVRLVKADGAWRMVEPWQARSDHGAADGALGRLASARMLGIVAEEDGAAVLRKYGLDRPAVTAHVGSGSARATLQIGAEAEDGTRYARDASRPLVFTVDATLVEDLTREAAEYRRRDVFDFRPFNASRLEVTRDGEIVAFEKVRTEGAPDVWTRVGPSDGEVDRDGMDEALSALSRLRAESFTGDKPGVVPGRTAATVVVGYNDGAAEERVVLAREGNRAYAGRQDEAGAAVLDAAALDEALTALDALIAPSPISS